MRLQMAMTTGEEFKTVRIRKSAYEKAVDAVRRGVARSICDVVSRAVELYLSEEMDRNKAIEYTKEILRYLEQLEEQKGDHD